jgi:hypothetical protein
VANAIAAGASPSYHCRENAIECGLGERSPVNGAVGSDAVGSDAAVESDAEVNDAMAGSDVAASLPVVLWPAENVIDGGSGNVTDAEWFPTEHYKGDVGPQERKTR